jgi:hypothetical protein
VRRARCAGYDVEGASVLAAVWCTLVAFGVAVDFGFVGCVAWCSTDPWQGDVCERTTSGSSWYESV